MIHSATDNPKFRKLVRRIRGLISDSFVSVEVISVGILERLWHATIRSAPKGDIGSLENEDIAEMVGWFRDADELIEILVDCGWLDTSDEHRLVVHDWHEHAPRFVKGNVARHKAEFASLKPSQGSSLKETPKGTSQSSLPCDPPHNITEHNITKPNGTEENSPSENFSSSESEGAESPERATAPDPKIRNSESVFRNLTPDDLKDSPRLRSWFEWQAKPPDPLSPVLESSDDGWRKCLEAAEQAIASGRNSVALFASLVGKKDFTRISKKFKEKATKRFIEWEKIRNAA